MNLFQEKANQVCGKTVQDQRERSSCQKGPPEVRFIAPPPHVLTPRLVPSAPPPAAAPGDKNEGYSQPIRVRQICSHSPSQPDARSEHSSTYYV